MICISLLQIVIFGYNSYVGGIGLNGPVFHCSHLIFDPDKRHQVWRYLTYMLIHSGLFHAIFNILIQLILGLPLEMVNGWWRVMLVYCSGVLAGSLWTSVLKPDKFLAGASGGGMEFFFINALIAKSRKFIRESRFDPITLQRGVSSTSEFWLELTWLGVKCNG